jgi:hypothetical protein
MSWLSSPAGAFAVPGRSFIPPPGWGAGEITARWRWSTVPAMAYPRRWFRSPPAANKSCVIMRELRDIAGPLGVLYV